METTFYTSCVYLNTMREGDNGRMLRLSSLGDMGES
jgi:hypothetical protein